MALLIVGSFFGLGSRKTLEQRFWDWFAQHSSELIAVSTCRESICDELCRELRKIDKGLVYTFGPTQDGRREFIVSADGIRSVFPAVKKLVAAAPDLSGWKIIAFRPPVGVDMTIRLPDGELGPDDVWFHAQAGQQGVALELYIRDYSEARARPLGQAAFLLLDYALGEYDVETKLGALDFKALPADPATAGLKPFRDLPATVRRLMSATN